MYIKSQFIFRCNNLFDFYIQKIWKKYFLMHRSLSRSEMKFLSKLTLSYIQYDSELGFSLAAVFQNEAIWQKACVVWQPLPSLRKVYVRQRVHVNFARTCWVHIPCKIYAQFASRLKRFLMGIKAFHFIFGSICVIEADIVYNTVTSYTMI